MTTPLIERVARALIEDDPYLMVPENGPPAGPFGLSLEEFVRTAIEAMRQPSEGMKLADSIETEVWRVMIDAALKGEG